MKRHDWESLPGQLGPPVTHVVQTTDYRAERVVEARHQIDHESFGPTGSQTQDELHDAGPV